MSRIDDVINEAESMVEAEIGFFDHREYMKAREWAARMLRQGMKVWMATNQGEPCMVADRNLNDARAAQVAINRTSGHLVCNDPRDMEQIKDVDDFFTDR